MNLDGALLQISAPIVPCILSLAAFPVPAFLGLGLGISCPPPGCRERHHCFRCAFEGLVLLGHASLWISMSVLMPAPTAARPLGPSSRGGVLQLGVWGLPS